MSEGEKYFKEAEGKINRFMFNDHEAAMELFNKSGACFKSEKNFNRAGDAFMRAGDMATKLKDPGSAVMAYTECAKAYQKGDLKKAIIAMDVAVKLNIEGNRLGAAARLLKDFAEALEQNGRVDDALTYYKKSADYFRAEDQPTTANACLSKMAKILGDLDRWPECCALYEKLGTSYAEGPLKHQAKEQFFRAFLCRCAMISADNMTEKTAEAAEALESYLMTDIYLKNTRELEACQNILQAIEEADESKFDEVMQNLDELKMIDEWKAHVLLAVKHRMSDTR